MLLIINGHSLSVKQVMCLVVQDELYVALKTMTRLTDILQKSLTSAGGKGGWGGGGGGQVERVDGLMHEHARTSKQGSQLSVSWNADGFAVLVHYIWT